MADQEIIDKEFRKAMGLTSNTSSAVASDEPMTIEKLKEAMRLVQPVQKPIPLRKSKHVPALGTVTPKSQPITDDMRAMCDDIGPQKVPVAYVLDTPFGRLAVTNPINVKESSG